MSSAGPSDREMQNESRSHITILAVSVLLLGCGLLLVGLLNGANPFPHAVIPREEPATSVPQREAGATNSFDYGLLQDLEIQSGFVRSAKPHAWQTAAIFLADRENSQVFIDDNLPVPLQEPWKEDATNMWFATVHLGDFQDHDVRVLDGNGRLLRGASTAAALVGEPSPIFKYVSQ